ETGPSTVETIRVTKLTWRDTADADLLTSARYAPARDARSQRMLSVPLPRAVTAGETVVLDLRWTALLAPTRGADVLGAGWYPQLVQADAPASACDVLPAGQTVGVEIADFEVTLAAPAGWIVAATGREARADG